MSRNRAPKPTDHRAETGHDFRPTAEEIEHHESGLDDWCRAALHYEAQAAVTASESFRAWLEREAAHARAEATLSVDALEFLRSLSR